MHKAALLITVLLIGGYSCNTVTEKPTQISDPSFDGSTTTGREETPDPRPGFADLKVGEIELPGGYKRISGDNFAQWLRNIDLKGDNTVYLFDGRPKGNQDAQYAVLDIDVPNRDLQQCADAVMRLRAEYQLAEGDADKIIFYDNEGTEYRYSEGQDFGKYLLRVFGMCGTASLSKQMHSKAYGNDIKPGDVLIRGGFPGHAVMVMDVARNKNGSTIYMLSQSYMPAQNIHILKNPKNSELSPWFEVNDDDLISTPEYTFKRTELKEW